jgi:hypothetical protein
LAEGVARDSVSTLYTLVAVGFGLLAVVAPYLMSRMLWKAFQSGRIRVPGSRFIIAHAVRWEEPWAFYSSVGVWILIAILLELTIIGLLFSTLAEKSNADCLDLHAHCTVRSVREIIY